MRGAVDLLELLAEHRVVVREVDRLGDLGVALVERLARLGARDLEEACAVFLELLPGTVEDARTLIRAERLPLVGGGDSTLDGFVERGLVIDARLLDEIGAERRGCHAVGDLPRPRTVARKVRVGVGSVVEAAVAARGDALLDAGLGTGRVVAAAVLRAVRLRHVVRLDAPVAGDRLEVVERSEEALLLTLEQLLAVVQLEHGRHEVLVARALFEATDQVGDRDVELLRVHDRRVEQKRPDVTLHDLRLARGHAEEHLELDALLGAALGGEQPGEGHIEEVVAGDADAHVLHAVGVKCVVKHGLVAGVRALLGVPRRGGPAVNGGIHVLHRQVRALHDAHLDRCTSVGDALRSPLLQVHHRSESVGQVGLKHDPGLEVLELGAVEDAGEDRKRQIEVLVLLHVEVDELLWARVLRLRQQRCEVVLDALDGLVEGPVVVRCDRRRHLDRNVVDVGAREERLGACDAALGLVLAEDGLTEQVDVQLDVVLLDLRDRGAQLGVGGVDDEVADHLTQHLAGDRNDDVRQRLGERSAESDRAAEHGGEELRRERCQLGELLGRGAEVFRAHDAVDEADGEVQSVGIAQDSGETFRRRVGGDVGRFGEPALHESDGFVGEILRTDVLCSGRLSGGGGTHGVPFTRARAAMLWGLYFPSV